MRTRKYKSKINQRIFQSAKKIGLVFAVLFLVVSFGKISGTNSFFMDTATSAGNTVTAGYWIPPTVSVTSPGSGDEWQVGSSHNITWTADSSDPSATASMDVDIDYKCDAGSYSSIATGEANDGTYSWTIPPTISSDCYVRVTATDSHGLTNSNESDQFEISWMVVLNEFLPNPEGDESGPKPNGEWVELYNNGSESINVSGWHLYDALDHDLPITSSNTDTGGTTIASHGWLVVYRDGDGDFSLNNDGDTVKLYDGNIPSANLLDSYSYSSTTEGKTYARVPDGTGGWVDPVPTPGEKNTRSNDLEDFQKYYEEFCFDKKDKPTCDKEFMESLDLLKKDTGSTSSPQADPAADAPASNTDPADGAPVSDTVPADEESADSINSPQADPEPATEDPGVETPTPPVDPEVTPETEVEVVPDSTSSPQADTSEEPAVEEEKPVVEEKPADVPAEEDEEEEIKKDEAAKPDDNKESDAPADQTN